MSYDESRVEDFDIRLSDWDTLCLCVGACEGFRPSHWAVASFLTLGAGELTSMASALLFFTVAAVTPAIAAAVAIGPIDGPREPRVSAAGFGAGLCELYELAKGSNDCS